MACSYENYGVFAPARSRIKVFDFHETGRKVPYTCTQCDEAWCMRACPVGAITVDAASADFLSADQLHMNDWSYDCLAKLLSNSIVVAATRTE